MGKLLHFEFHKLIRQKSFYICLAVAVAMLFVSTYTTYLMQKDAVDIGQMGIDGMHVMIGAVSGGTLSMVIGVFVPLFRMRGLCLRHDTQYRYPRLHPSRSFLGKAHRRLICVGDYDYSLHGGGLSRRNYILCAGRAAI